MHLKSRERVLGVGRLANPKKNGYNHDVSICFLKHVQGRLPELIEHPTIDFRPVGSPLLALVINLLTKRKVSKVTGTTFGLEVFCRHAVGNKPRQVLACLPVSTCTGAFSLRLPLPAAKDVCQLPLLKAA